MTAEGDGLSAEDKARLAPFVTSTESPVFALTRLPEVVKGALFSRYSRSTLGLRRLLLKEFLAEADAEALRAGAGEEAYLSVTRAQNFYDRILDGYGDDSIGELGGAHLALEDVSMVATKLLEAPRIGGSPLEKSTRYVPFDQTDDGEFRFYREPRIMASAHRERYLALMRRLFGTYRELLEPLQAWIAGQVPREPDTPEAAWRRSVRARALDALRGLLPAATRTNMGIFGNGRFFESLILRLRLSPLTEAHELAEAMQRELGKVIPSFIRRADPAHPHFAGFRDFDQGLQRAVRALAAEAPRGGRTPGTDEEVTLVQHDPDGETALLAALAYPYTDTPLADLHRWAAGLGDAERQRWLDALAAPRDNRRHKLPRALEHVSYTFDLVGDFGMYRDLQRHRVLTQTRQRLGCDLGYTVPAEVAAAGLEEPYREAMAAAAADHAAIAADFPEEAQYAVPMAYRLRWHFRLNLRELTWLVELRSTPQGHPAYRRMVQRMYREVERVHPRLARLVTFVDLADHALGRLGAEARHERRHSS